MIHVLGSKFYDTLNTEFKLSVKRQIVGRSTALTLLSKHEARSYLYDT